MVEGRLRREAAHYEPGTGSVWTPTRVSQAARARGRPRLAQISRVAVERFSV
jgi:hypothetical protein